MRRRVAWKKARGAEPCSPARVAIHMARRFTPGLSTVLPTVLIWAAVAQAADPPAAPAPAEAAPQPTLTTLLPKPRTDAKPLNLRVGSIRSYMTPEEFRALSDPPDEANTIIVSADAPLVPMKSELDVPGGILAPFWALAHPTKAWRLFLPDARVNIKDIPPPDSKIPPPVFRWGP